MEITKDIWKEFAALLYKHKISYTTRYTNDDKHIQINLNIPNYYEDMIVEEKDNLCSKTKERLIKNANREFFYTVIYKQIANCIVNENYRAGIFTSNFSNLKTISDILKTIIVEFEEYLIDVRPVLISKNGIKIYFKNGSYIIGGAMNEGQRARRLNDIIYDVKIDKDIIDCIIRPMFVKHHPNDIASLKMIGVEF